MVVAVDFLLFSSNFPQTALLAFSFEEDPQTTAVLKAEILPKPLLPVFYLICSLLARYCPTIEKSCCYYCISLSLPFFSKVVLALLGDEKPLLMKLPSRSSCHFLFLSYLLQSFRWPLCFFFPFLPQSFCSPTAWVKPAVSFPHLPSFSRMTSFDMWLPLPLLPPCSFLAQFCLLTVTRPDLAGWLTGLVWSTALNIFLFPDSSQCSFLISQVFFLLL